MTAEQIEGQLSKPGGTVYHVDSVAVDLDDGLSVPMSALNALRRESIPLN